MHMELQSCDALNLVKLPFQRVSIKWIAGAGLDAHTEALLVSDGEAHLHTELVRPMGFPLANALHLGGVQAVDLVLCLPLLLQDQFGQDQRPLVLLEGGIVDLSLHIPHDAPCHGLQTAKHLPGPLELLGLHVPAVLAESSLHQQAVALPKVKPLLLRNPKHGPVHLPIQPRICWVLDGLRLHRGIDDHPLEAALRDGLASLPRVDREAQQLLHTCFTDSLSPSRHLAWMDREFVLKELLPTEELPVGIQHPLCHHLLVRESEGVLEEMKSCHQADRNSRPAVVGAIQVTELGFQPAPVDDPGQFEKFLLRIQNHL